MKKDLEQAITVAVKELFDAEVAVGLARPDEQFGDYATNVALQLAGKVGKNPREVAEQLAVKLRENLAKEVSEISIAGPGFLNLKLTDLALVDLAMAKPTQPYASQEVLVEFGDPNPFKQVADGITDNIAIKVADVHGLKLRVLRLNA